MISAPQPEAVEAGLEAFKRSGNVMDAAIAAALVQTVVDPQMCGIAGFGSMQIIRPQDGGKPLYRFSWQRAAVGYPRHVGAADRA